MGYNSVKNIRYMGNKAKLLDFIIPEIEKVTNEGDVICDLMAGTCAISYALKSRNRIYTNDIQNYSCVISNAIIVGNKSINSKKARELLESDFNENMKNYYYSFFKDHYSDTYFSANQCLEIDSVRYAIDKLKQTEYRDILLLALMCSMSTCESTPGHFAQYMNKDHYRLTELRKMSIFDTMMEKCDDYKNIVKSKYINKSFNEDAIRLIKSEEFKEVDCVYIDTPYTAEQYSRFYHILETVCRYDNPTIENNKGLYRDDRYKSKFSKNSSVKEAFSEMINLLSDKGKTIVVSYSNRGLVGVEDLRKIIYNAYGNCEVKYMSYKHSTQGKGNINIDEVLFIAISGGEK